MSRMIMIALVAASLATPALASGQLTVTVSDRGTGAAHSAEAQRIFAQLAAEDN